MRFYDTIFLRKHTRRMLLVFEYSRAFHEFYKDLDQGFVDCLSNFNIDHPTYWQHWNKACEISDWCYNNEIHPEDFWKYAYRVIQDTGNGTKSFNTFFLPWVLEGVLTRKKEEGMITMCRSYHMKYFLPGNIYFLLYYQATIDRVTEKYGSGDGLSSVLTTMIGDGSLHIEVFEDFGTKLNFGGK